MWPKTSSFPSFSSAYTFAFYPFCQILKSYYFPHSFRRGRTSMCLHWKTSKCSQSTYASNLQYLDCQPGFCASWIISSTATLRRANYSAENQLTTKRLLGTFANLWEATISFVISVYPYGKLGFHWIFLKYDICVFFENLSNKLKLH
jgi:hypothetical protein